MAQLTETVARLWLSLSRCEIARIEWTTDQLNNVAYRNEHDGTYYYKGEH